MIPLRRNNLSMPIYSHSRKSTGSDPLARSARGSSGNPLRARVCIAAEGVRESQRDHVVWAFAPVCARGAAMKAAIWLRVSDPTRQTPENQLAPLRAEAERRGLEVVKVYEVGERAYQGAHLKALSEVYADARLGQFKVLMCWSLDRLSRQGAAAILGIVKTPSERNVELVSLKEPWLDMLGPFREPLLAIMGWIAKYESERRSERTRAGLERAKADGRVLGRPQGSRDKRQRKKSGYFKRWSATRDEVGAYRIN